MKSKVLLIIVILILIVGGVIYMNIFQKRNTNLPKTVGENAMITSDRALEIARKFIADSSWSEVEWVILEDKILEKDFGWVFYYTTKKHAETGDIKYAIPGNAPVIVNRDGYASFTSTSVDTSRIINEYEKAWKDSVVLEWTGPSDKKTRWEEWNKNLNWYQPPTEEQVLNAYYDSIWQKSFHIGYDYGYFGCLSFERKQVGGKQTIKIRVEKKFQEMLIKDEWKTIAEDSIGIATMLQDGTIVLHLRAEDKNGTLGDAQLIYPPSHSQYEAILSHLGGLKPGESKSVPPWPDHTGD
jgi:hypothetical protein